MNFLLFFQNTANDGVIFMKQLPVSSVSSGEYDGIFHQAFRDFYIDESQLFRYAKRRNAKKKVLLHISKSDLRMGL